MTDFNQKTHDTDVGSHGGQSRQMMEVFENQEFGSIRLLQEAGKTFFCASDVAKALGYVNPYAAVKRHCRDPLTKREGVVQKVNQYGDAGEQVVEISFITEGDVYRLIVHSKLPSAERFEHWVFDEVLPSIRKHGVYMSDSILDQVIQHPEVIYTLAQELVAEREQLEGIRKQLDAAQPKADYRRAELVEKYNELFNSTRPREYDGSHIRFGGMNPEIRLREHQQNAIAHVLYGGNTLLAHEVGAGKTFEMAASAMEAKRLGLCQKSMFVVPNHLTLQWANEFLRLYPSAKLLVASKKDFETARRKKFCARIATGDYDAVIIGHSQFEKIPVSAERQERILTAQIDEIENAIAEMKSQNGERFSIKQMEKTRKGLEARLEKLRATDRKDDVITFEQLGVDRLFVDEAHAFKNLFLYTKMRNVAGLSTSEAQKSSDMFMKCQYIPVGAFAGYVVRSWLRHLFCGSGELDGCVPADPD